MPKPVIKAIDNERLFASVESILAEGGRVRIRVKGNSMRPFLRNDRDTVILAPLPDCGIRKGMLVLFRDKERIILHRLRHMESGRLTAAGDGNYRKKEHFTESDIIGYAAVIEKNGRTVKYRSARWNMLSAASLSRCALRRAVLDILSAVRCRTNG